MTSILNDGMSQLKTADVEIFKRYPEAELVAVMHKNGAVGIYAEEDDVLFQVSPLMKSDTLTPDQMASRLMGCA